MKKWNELTFDEKLVLVSLYPEDAKNDENWLIRLRYYRHNKDDRDALDDENWDIKKEAKIYFDFVDSRDK